MSPTLKPNNSVLASPLPYLFYKPKVGDIVVCLDPRDKKVLMKRIKKIIDHNYFIAGDNQDESTDSRTFGPIQKKDIIGKVVYKFEI